MSKILPCSPVTCNTFSPVVSILFARKNSIYKKNPLCDVWDIDRNATFYAGHNPVVAHPPCRGWGRLSGQSKHTEDEKNLGFFAVEQVRRVGGVLEHPAHSKLWKAINLPRPGKRDDLGGWTLPVLQFWWGHRALKSTWLYIVGCEPREIPVIPLRLDLVPSSIENMGKGEREATPFAFAEWLVDLAMRCAL